MAFVKAEKKQAKLRLGITGPSGSGKTFTALTLSKGIGGKVAVADTEHGSASLYADKFDFDVMEIKPPYTVDKFLTAIHDAKEGGYSILILDSITHEWQGDGSLMDKKVKIDAQGGNSFTNFAKITPDHDRFIAGMLGSGVHLIATMRSKTEYVLDTNDRGKQAPKKMGMAPVQRDGMEYEFTTVFDMTIAHDATVSKDRSGLFDGQVFRPTEKTGKQLAEWLQSGKSTTPAAPQPSTPPSSGTESAAGPSPEAPKAGPGISEDAMTEVLKDLASAGEKSLLDLGTFMKSPGVKALYKRMTAEQADELTVKAGEWKGYWSTRAG